VTVEKTTRRITISIWRRILGWNILQKVGQGFRIIKLVRAPLVISTCAALFLSVPDQTREVYRILAQDFAEGVYLQSMIALILSPSVAVLIWLITRNIFHTANALSGSGFEGIVALCLPRICGALIPFGIAVGLWMASTDLTLEPLHKQTLEMIPQLKEIRDQMASTVSLLRLASGLQFLSAVALLVLTHRRSLGNCPPSVEFKGSLFGPLGWLVLTILLATACIYFVVFPVTGPQFVGTTAIVLMFVVVLTFLTSMLTTYFDQYGIPIVTLLILLAVLFSAFNWNDNHLVRMARLPEPTKFSNTKSAFQQWIDSRQDRDHYTALKQSYPVFVVAAAGGGLYAAYHTATVLARLQDRCPNFAQHVFAISAVSGGSLGAALFESLASRYAENGPYKECTFGLPGKGQLEARATKFLESDFLAPVIAAGLFPDFVQRFIPYPIEQFDRARALEASFELAWTHAAPEFGSENPFAESYINHYWGKPPVPGQPMRPTIALILNTTEVEYGYRVVIAPFRILDVRSSLNPTFSGLTEFQELIGHSNYFEYDLRLSSAVGLSSRFPWLLPAGLAHRGNYLDPAAFRLLDGGIFENSGIETADDLVGQLADQTDVKIHLIYIGQSLPTGHSWQGMGEILSPIRALLAARSQRGQLAEFRSDEKQRRCTANPTCLIGLPVEFPLNLDDFKIPLGWQLSPLTRRVIELHGGSPDRARITWVNPNSFELFNETMRLAIGFSDVGACKIASMLTYAPQPCY
jgi:hypothetical protein